MLRIARFLTGTTAEGPGRRTAVWTQGCSIRCSGCINPQLFSTRGGRMVEVDALVEAALSAGDEGFTLLGGEPFDQAEDVGDLARAAQRAGLGVIVFSGYERADLEQRSEVRDALVSVDLLVDGPYRSDEPELERALVGSRNQRFHHLSSRYESYDPQRRANAVDVRLLPDGSIEVAGFLRSDEAHRFTQLLEVRRSRRAGQTPGGESTALSSGHDPFP